MNTPFIGRSVTRTKVFIKSNLFTKGIKRLEKREIFVFGSAEALAIVSSKPLVYHIYVVSIFEFLIFYTHLSNERRSKTCFRIKRFGGIY